MDFSSVPVQFIKPPDKNPWKAELFVLRLDLADPALGGNKWFKLYPWFRKPEVENAEILSTMGGPWSNHLIAFAEMCFRKGKRAELWIRGEEPKQINPRLEYLLQRGCGIRFISREAYRELRAGGQHPEGKSIPFLPEGGFSMEGSEGVAESMAPLTQGYERILCAAGTGTTAAGLIKGRNGNSRIIVFPALQAGKQIEDNILRLLGKPSAAETPFQVLDAWPGLRFGKITPEIQTFIEHFHSVYQLPLDPIYTAKMMMSLIQGPGRDILETPGKCLFIHTGGLFTPPQNTLKG